jgi:hypothetical protein
MAAFRQYWLILLIWALVSIVLVVQSWTQITTLSGWDPDDQLRLVQLRDFLGGQSWFDATQYRMNPPDGAPMHWSRLVELPLALLVLTLSPLFGLHGAEMLAGTMVPLLLLAWITVMLTKIAERISSREAGLVAALITLSSSTLLMQLRPMRIDHHGWQIAMAVLALSTIFWVNGRNAGRILGLALAVWLHISLEGAPMTAAFFLFLGVRWIRDPEQGQRLFWTLLSFCGISMLLFFATQSQGFYAASYCDTVSPPHIFGIVFATASMLVAIAYLSADWRLRLAAAIIASFGALLIIFNMAPQCTGGAFGNLDPLVREYWYSNIKEGLPIWHQDWRTALGLMVGLLTGAICWVMLLRRAKGDDRAKIVSMGFFLLYGLLLSLVVVRTISVASAFAVPVTATFIAMLFKRYRQSKIPLQRVALVAAMLALLVPSVVVTALTGLMPASSNKTELAAKMKNEKCQSATSVAALAKLPDAIFIAPFDMGPMILVQTPNKVLASSHHRNERAMHDHIEIFRSQPAESYRLMKAHGITHFVACENEAELDFYKEKNPKGLWAQLSKGKSPEYLKSLPDMGSGIQVWRVR